MLNKTIKVQIIKPINETWDNFGEILRDLRYKSCKVCNMTINICVKHEELKKNYKEENGNYPKDIDLYGLSLQGYLYRELTKEFPDISPSNISQTYQYALKRWKSDKNKVLSLQQSIPSFKLDTPISIKNDYIISNNENDVTITANLLRAKEEKYKFNFNVWSRDNSTKTILNRIISGEYKKGAMQIVQDRKNKWYCLITYGYEQKESCFDKNKIMGIDMGIVNAVYWAFNFSLNRGYIEGGEINEFRKKIQARRRTLQKQIKYCGESRKGHGRERALLPIKILSEKESNARNSINHKYAKYIVGQAIKNECGTIQLENLSGINIDNKFLKNWTYYDLKTKIEYKAKEKGIDVIEINPHYTSQRCSKCGFISNSNRETQAKFECTSCGFSTNADYNAARNIATKDIELIIKKQIKNIS